jgi:AraC family transcriptional activator of pobA
MRNEEIYLFELAKSQYGLVITPMLSSFVPVEDEPTAFDPHRHDFYGLFLLRTGEMSIVVEEQEVIMHGSELLLVQPGQVHHCIQSDDISGWVMFFDGKHLDSKIRAVTEKSSDEIALFDLNSDDLRFTDQLLLSVFQASQNNNPGPLQVQMLHALINALFYQVANMQLLRESSPKTSASRPAQIVQEFKSLVKSNFSNLKRPADYAALLHISVSHLNDTVKANTGYSATHILQQEIVGEAKRQLRYSSKTIKEIAANLGYNDYKYFIRLFSKILGQSPSVFRKNTKLSTAKYPAVPALKQL